MAATAAGAGSSRPPAATAVGLAVVVMLMATAATPAEGFISGKTWRAIRRANRVGAPFVGLVVPNAYEMGPVLNSPGFKPSDDIPILDVQAPSHHHPQVRSCPSSAARENAGGLAEDK